MTQTIGVILHNPAGQTGTIGELLHARGYALDIRCPLAGDPIHRPEDLAALVVFGGNMSVNDQLPALQAEIQLIRAMVARDRPYLGICLGAQLLAKAFGGHVTRHPEYFVEIGYYPIYPTIAGFLGIFAEMPERFFQWHNEGFTLPEEAVKLAASDLYPNQAFQLGRAYGFQFHPEATPAMVDSWHQRHAQELQNPGAQTRSAQLAYRDQLSPALRAWMEQFLFNFWLAEVSPT